MKLVWTLNEPSIFIVSWRKKSSYATGIHIGTQKFFKIMIFLEMSISNKIDPIFQSRITLKNRSF